MLVLACALLAAVCAASAIVETITVRSARAADSATGPRATGAGRPAGRATSLIAALGHLGRRGGLPVPAPGDLERRVQAAGLPASVAVSDLVAVKAGAAIATALWAFAVLLPAAPGRLGPVLAVAAPAAGFLAPDLWLARRARARAKLLAVDLPDVLDLTRVAVASGLPVGRSLRTVGHLRGGLLAGELRVCADLIDLGVPRGRALERLGARCPLPGVLALIAAMQRTERHGTPLAPTLAALAADARAERARHVADRAAKAAPKIQLAVALLLVPAAMLLMAAGMVASMV